MRRLWDRFTAWLLPIGVLRLTPNHIYLRAEFLPAGQIILGRVEVSWDWMR